MTMTKALSFTTLAVLAAVAALWLAPGLHAQEGDAQEARAQTADAAVEVVRAFHGALAAGDSTRVLSHLHEDVTIYEGGHAETRAQYRSGHLRSDMAFLAEMTRDIQAEETVVGDGVVLYTSRSRTTGTFRDRDIDSHGTESMLLVETAQGWKIRHIHWSSR